MSTGIFLRMPLHALALLAVSGCASHPNAAPPTDASNPTASDPPASEESIAEPAPLPSGPWKPAAAVASEPGKFAWAEVNPRSACPEPSPFGGNAAHVRVITTEIDFKAAYCRASLVDWSRFRLAVIPYSEILVDITVVPDDSQVRVLLQTRPSCEADWGNHLHLLLPAKEAHVVVVRKLGPPVECADGYGY